MELEEVKQNPEWFKRIAMQFISERDFNRIRKASVNLKFKKGETIFKQGGKSTHIAYLETGIVKFNYETESRKNLILTIVSAPKILGGANIFHKDNNLFSLVAVEACDVVLYDADVMVEVLKDNSKFAMVMYQLASEMFKESILNFISLAYKHKEGRIADIILYLVKHVYMGKSFQLTLTRKELAEFAGCSTENVIMTLSKWQQAEYIRTEGKSFEILDMEKLKYISKIG
jgi:CRP/FNR family transcriptional regulator, polysaccharide utilization system transcription regulator